MNALLSGPVAGLTATVPMTWVMDALNRRLPPEERYPLPPREITSEVTKQAGVRHQLEEGDHQNLTLAAHFAYGAAAATLYAALAPALPRAPLATGMAYGLAVWAGSYLGLLPALGILRPATEHPPRRTALMIAAHLVWGAANGLIVDRLGRRR
jgi:uncharacterized membrane protein YagU involved in acid resistance